ncbi:OmpA family protein [Roseomonas frigidaquae]|uniref:OmpA family protein n=1 Tax=Falsiroseomonas frigidaquae TaxID=487318 RepID=A0ABX1F3L7_9PROT|nr:OmpA family protein [Falsiroseomonas frigidaquae]NKE46940.1 OmpA family protein [Falsiroseomonas frigidaquae]
MRRSLVRPGLAGMGLGLLLLLPQPARAQAAVPEVERLIEGLDPASPVTRGIRVPAAPTATDAPAPGIPAPGVPAPGVPAPELTTTTAPPGAAAISLTVTFASGSAELGPEAMGVLDNLGKALGSTRLAGYRFRVEGHTDSVGTAAMNQALSERRATAVRDFLLRRHGVDPARIEASGLGETQLLVPTGDEAAEPRNRRVQVVNLGG